MAKFFGRIRKGLLSENRFTKYLIYAVGEILLVVVGILLALQINAWNDQRVRNDEFSNIYLGIIEELEGDIKILDEYLPEYKWKNVKLKKIVREDISLEDWTNKDSLFRSFTSYPDFEIGQQRFELLKSKVAIDEKTKALNRIISDFYHKHSSNIAIKNTEATLSFNRNIEHWEENEEWLSQGYVDKNYRQLGKYAIGNPLFRNKIAWYSIVLRRLEKALREYQDEAKILKKKIKDYLDNKN